MRLLNFSYKEDSWELEDLNLQVVNLIVGQNGTGKTRTLDKIDRFVKILTQQEKKFETEEWKVEFVTINDQNLRYELKTMRTKNEITKEVLYLNNELILERKKGEITFKIRKDAESDWDSYTPPAQKLAIFSINDIIKYPHTAAILNWAENSYGFEFSNSMKCDYLPQDLLNTTQETAKLFELLNKKQKQNLIEDLNSIGFKIENITIEKFGKADNTVLLIDETGLNHLIFQSDLSQGTSRTLSLLIYLEYLINYNKKPATIVIDDFGEGLDYIRAKELGKLVFEKCRKKKVQLIATSNDSFLMDVVDIAYWHVLIRNEKKVRAINKINQPAIFEDFVFEGTSNFNFFSSSYLSSHL
jgi:hypothetical protein